MGEDFNIVSGEVLASISRAVSDLGLFTKQAGYTYFTDGYTKHEYFYNTHKILHKGKLRYVAGIYRYVTYKQILVPRYLVGFARKKLAIAWAVREVKRATEYYKKLQEKKKKIKEDSK